MPQMRNNSRLWLIQATHQSGNNLFLCKFWFGMNYSCIHLVQSSPDLTNKNKNSRSKKYIQCKNICSLNLDYLWCTAQVMQHSSDNPLKMLVIVLYFITITWKLKRGDDVKYPSNNKHFELKKLPGCQRSYNLQILVVCWLCTSSKPCIAIRGIYANKDSCAYHPHQWVCVPVCTNETMSAHR